MKNGNNWHCSMRALLASAVVSFCIDIVHADTIDPNDLPATPFFAVHAPSDAAPAKSYGEFTWSGPNLGTHVAIPSSLVQMVSNGDSSRFFGLRNGDIDEVVFDPNSGGALVDIGQPVPPLSHPRGIGYDSVRDRVVAATLGGSGYIYGYDLASDTWSTLQSLGGLDMFAFSYFPPNDRMYGISGGGNSVRLHEFDSNGNELGLKLIEIELIGDSLNQTNQLIPVGDYFAFIQYYSGPEGVVPTMHAIDPVTGDTVFLSGPLPEPSTSLLLGIGLAVLCGGRRRSGRSPCAS